MPSVSATICEKIVFVPWPISVLAASTRTRPSAVASTSTTDARCTSPDPVKPAPCMNVAKPMPFLIRAPRLASREARDFLAIVRQHQRPIEQQLHLDRLAHDLADGARLVLLDEVAPAQLVGREPDRVGDDVHVALEREEALRRAEPAKRAVRRRGRRHDAAANAHVRTEVRTRGVQRAAREHDRRQRAVRAAIQHEVDVHREQPPVAIDDGPVPRARRVALGRRDHVFRAVVDELHRAAGLPRQQRRMGRDMRRVLFLAAEAAARLHLHDAHVVPRQAEQRRQRLVHVVRALQRSPDGDAVRRAGDGDHALRLDVELLLRAGFVLAFDDRARPARARRRRRRA